MQVTHAPVDIETGTVQRVRNFDVHEHNQHLNRLARLDRQRQQAARQTHRPLPQTRRPVLMAVAGVSHVPTNPDMQDYLADEIMRGGRQHLEGRDCPACGRDWHELGDDIERRRACWAVDPIWLELRREPNNPHDPNAIQIWHPWGRIGYMPAALAARVAPQLDAGRVVRCCVAAVRVRRNHRGRIEGTPGVDVWVFRSENAPRTPFRPPSERRKPYRQPALRPQLRVISPTRTRPLARLRRHRN